MPSVLSADGTRIAYDVFGEGPPLVFITGAICHRNFDPVLKDAKVFAQSFSVYNYDRRGRGDSTDTQPYSVSKELEDLEAIIQAAGGSAFIYGHSSGAMLALEAAFKLASTKVKKVIAYDPACAESEEARADWALFRTEIANLISAGKNAAAVKAFLKNIGLPKLFVHLMPLMPGWKKIKALAPTLLYDMEITKDLPPVTAAQKLTTPVLVMYGEKSPPSMEMNAKALAGSSQFLSVKVIPGQDHMVNPKQLLPEFEAFFLGDS